jgi:hypothetical protein
MLGKTSVSMMVLLVAASLIGISSIHHYVEGQGPPAAIPKPQQQTRYVVQGHVLGVDIYVSSDGKACIAEVQLLGSKQNNPATRSDGTIVVLAPNESFCTLFGQSKIGKTQIVAFIAQK